VANSDSAEDVNCRLPVFPLIVLADAA
jgi:hypothetical protein